MTASPVLPRSVKTIRRIARIWSILVTALILLIFFLPDSEASGPVVPVDIFLLSLTGIALLGLLVAWRWELAGGIFTLAMMVLREIAWLILKGQWLAGFLILWIFIAPPAVLFLVAWGLHRRIKFIPAEMEEQSK